MVSQKGFRNHLTAEKKIKPHSVLSSFVPKEPVNVRGTPHSSTWMMLKVILMQIGNEPRSNSTYIHRTFLKKYRKYHNQCEGENHCIQWSLRRHWGLTGRRRWQALSKSHILMFASYICAFAIMHLSFIPTMSS